MSKVARNLGLFTVCLLVLAGCGAERRAPKPFDDGGTATGCIGCAESSGSAGFGNAITASAGTSASSLAGNNGTTDTSSAGFGSSGSEFGEAGTSGTAAGSGGAAGTSAGAADGGTADPFSSGPCPAGFECVADPLVGMLHACLKSGPLPLPVECMTDADCVAAGLPKGTCITEEETGLTGCLQLCTPPATAAADGGT
jgi:hypothetical protein